MLIFKHTANTTKTSLRFYQDCKVRPKWNVDGARQKNVFSNVSVSLRRFQLPCIGQVNLYPNYYI